MSREYKSLVQRVALRIVEDNVSGTAMPETPLDKITKQDILQSNIRVHSSLIRPAFKLLRDIDAATEGTESKVRLIDKRWVHQSHSSSLFDELLSVEESAWFVVGEIHGHATCAGCRSEERLLTVADEKFDRHEVERAIQRLLDNGLIVRGEHGLRFLGMHVNDYGEGVRVHWDDDAPDTFDAVVEEFGFVSPAE